MFPTFNYSLSPCWAVTVSEGGWLPGWVHHWTVCVVRQHFRPRHTLGRETAGRQASGHNADEDEDGEGEEGIV